MGHSHQRRLSWDMILSSLASWTQSAVSSCLRPRFFRRSTMRPMIFSLRSLSWSSRIIFANTSAPFPSTSRRSPSPFPSPPFWRRGRGEGAGCMRNRLNAFVLADVLVLMPQYACVGNGIDGRGIGFYVNDRGSVECIHAGDRQEVALAFHKVHHTKPDRVRAIG